MGKKGKIKNYRRRQAKRQKFLRKGTTPKRQRKKQENRETQKKSGDENTFNLGPALGVL